MSTPQTSTEKPKQTPRPPSYEEVVNVRIETIDEPEKGNVVFTAVSSNHKSSFSTADTCCTCTT